MKVATVATPAVPGAATARTPTSPAADARAPGPVVNAHNEWDLLEEVVVGSADGAHVPGWSPMIAATAPEDQRGFFQRLGGRPFPAEVVDAARRELDGLAELLHREGVVVRVPSPLDHSRPFATPDWESGCGMYAAMPRDVLLVVGDEIIEAPMAWRCRYFEVNAYRPLLTEYFRAGARWTAAPRPTLRDEQFLPAEEAAGLHSAPPYMVTEYEPTFDAADFIRCGRDLFAQRSHVTNELGIEWLRRHLGPAYTVHVLEPDDPHPMHIDATMLPLAAGKLLLNPERLPEVPPQFRDWDVRFAPPPNPHGDRHLFMSSAWVSMNLLSLDERRVLVEEKETELQAMLRGWGMEPVPCPFRSFNALGGSFHCATLDVRRRGGLQSYF
jgi:glycine amidinotransferase